MVQPTRVVVPVEVVGLNKLISTQGRYLRRLAERPAMRLADISTEDERRIAELERQVSSLTEWITQHR